MNNYFHILDQTISEQQKTLHIKVEGFQNTAGRLRLTALFACSASDRRICIPLKCSVPEGGGCLYEGELQISLPYLYYQTDHPGITELSFYLSWPYEELCVSSTPITIPEEYTLSPARGSALPALLRFPVFLMLTLLLPLHMAAEAVSACLRTGRPSLTRVLHRINDRVKAWTEYSYSIRERKTERFRRYYKKYCRKPLYSNRLLFLSERPLEENSNLNCILKSLSEQKQLDIQSFVHPLPIAKMKPSLLKQAASLIASSAVVILEDFYPQLHVLTLRENTIVVQLWHACGAFKTFGFSRLGKPGGAPQNSPNHRSYDFAMVSGTRIAPIYSEAFAIPLSHVKAFGVPRTDLFFTEDWLCSSSEYLYQRFPLLKDKMIVLFAPTFRGNGNQDAHYPAEQFDIANLMGQLPENYVLVLKQHPFVHDTFDIPEQYKERVFDLSLQAGINQLFSITNLLITDYSSSVFEAALLELPTVFYVFDQEEYLRDRDVYFDFDCFAPGRIVTDQAGLPAAVLDGIGGENWQAERRKQVFMRNYLMDAVDGHCTERISEFILELVKE